MTQVSPVGSVGGTPGAGTAPAVVAMLWDQFGPYHMDRCEALGTALAGRARVIGIEVAAQSETYAWAATPAGRAFTKHTLFPDAAAEKTSASVLVRKLMTLVRAEGVTHLFVSGYERPGYFLAALLARARGVKCIVMLDSKYDDKPRRAPLEFVKRLMMLPYHGGFAAGTRSAAYLAMLGVKKSAVTTGYDTLSLARVRAAADGAAEVAWDDRPIVAVARFVPKKNLGVLVEAFAQFRAKVPSTRRRLVLCGDGPLRAQLHERTAALGIEDAVTFAGFLDPTGVAHTLSGALCLALPSTEEQWGLVVNEALAFDLPLLLATNVGAIDALAGSDNAFILDPHDVEGWTNAMATLDANHDLWARMAAASHDRAPLADVTSFVAGARAHVGV